MPKIIIPIIASVILATQFVPTEANVVGQRGGSNIAVVKSAEYDGEEFTADLPLYEHMKNIGGSDRAGLCVGTSQEMAGLYQCDETIRGLQQWLSRFPGGSYPQRVDKQLPEYYRSKGIPTPPYMQFESRDPQKIAQVLELINKTGRMACCTYGYSPRYPGKISHMVCSPHFGKYCAILDNNFPGSYEIMTREEGIRRMMDTSGAAWIFVWLTSPPPPPPKN